MLELNPGISLAELNGGMSLAELKTGTSATEDEEVGLSFGVCGLSSVQATSARREMEIIEINLFFII